MLLTVAVNIYLFVIVPKGFFPQQDTGRLIGNIQAEQDISSPAMRDKMAEFVNVVKADPAVSDLVAFTGGDSNTTNTGRVFVSLKPTDMRTLPARLENYRSHRGGPRSPRNWLAIAFIVLVLAVIALYVVRR